MKRFFSCFLILALLVGTLAGCGSSEKPQSNEAATQTVQADTPKEQKPAPKEEPEEEPIPTMPEMPTATLQVQCPVTGQTALVTYNSFFFNQTSENHINYWKDPYSVQVNFNTVDCDEEGQIYIALQRMMDERYDEDSDEMRQLRDMINVFHDWSYAGDVDVFYVGFCANCDAEGFRKLMIGDNIGGFGYTPVETVEVNGRTISQFTSYRMDNNKEYDTYYVYEFDGNIVFLSLYSFMDNGAMVFSDMFLVDVDVNTGVG